MFTKPNNQQLIRVVKTIVDLQVSSNATRLQQLKFATS